MSKIETLKGLPTPSELRQSVQDLQSLDQLPGLVAAEVTAALEPLARLRQDVQQVLQAYDAVTAHQRRALDEMAQEMSSRAVQGMQERAEVLDKTLQGLAGQARALQAATAAAESSSRGLQALPGKVTAAAAAAAGEMRSSAGLLAQQADRARPRMWRQALALVGAAVLAAVLVLAGQAGLSKLMPADLEQAWAQASPADRDALLRQIVSQRAR